MWYPSAVIRALPSAGRFGVMNGPAARSATPTKACGLSNPDAQAQEEAFLSALVADPARFWPAFLDNYSGVLLRMISRRLLDEDDRMEAYVFVCEKLAAGNLERIRRFTAEVASRRARFTTWLAAVVRNLCVDWLRSVKGRRMLPTAVEKLPARDQAIFRLVFWDGRSYAETEELLVGQGFERLGVADIGLIVESIHAALPTTSLWSALVEQSQHQPLVRLDQDPDDEGGAPPPTPIDTGDTPEAAWRRTALEEALSEQLAGWRPEDRLLLSLRFEDELKAREIAGIIGADSEATVYQRLRTLLDRLRRDLKLDHPVGSRGGAVPRGRRQRHEEAGHAPEELP